MTGRLDQDCIEEGTIKLLINYCSFEEAMQAIKSLLIFWLLVIHLLTVCIHYCVTIHIFTAVPEDKNVFLGKTVVIECATNISGFILSFSALTPDNQPLTIEQAGDVTAAITGTFTLTQDNNGTTVRCVASGAGLAQTGPAVFYGQDIDPPPDIMVVSPDPCTITLQWGQPFLLPGLSVSYTVSVYHDGDMVSVHNVSTTTISYHPTAGNGVYTVQVSAFNDTLTSDSTNTTVTVDLEISATNDRRSTQIKLENWIYQIYLLGVCSLTPATITAVSCNDVGSCYSTSNVSPIDNNGMITVNYTELRSDTKFNTSIYLEYNIDSEEDNVMLNTNNITTTTYSLQDAMLMSIATNEFCVGYYLAKGTDEYTVNATIECNGEDSTSLPASNIQVANEVCYKNVSPNNWTLYACDGGSSPCDSSNAAVSITDINVTGMPTAGATLSSTAIHLSTLSTTMSLVLTTSPSSTSTPPFLNTNTKNSVIVVVPIVCSILLLIISIICVIVIILSVIKKSLVRSKRKDDVMKIHRNRIASDSEAGLIQFDCRVQPKPNTHNYEDVNRAQQSTLNYADIEEIRQSVKQVQIVSQDEPSHYADIQGTHYNKCPESMKCKTIDHPPTQTELITVLIPLLSLKWMAIGLALKLNPDQLEEIRGNSPDDPNNCLKDVLFMWESNATDDKPYIWATMLEVLRSGKIKEKGLADYLQQNFML